MKSVEEDLELIQHMSQEAQEALSLYAEKESSTPLTWGRLLSQQRLLRQTSEEDQMIYSLGDRNG